EPPAKKTRNKKRNGRGDSIVMDSGIWKEFPEDLYEAVVARLPITAFFRFRSVCQKWNSLLASQSFSRECDAGGRRSRSWVYAITHESMNAGSMFDPSSNKWYHPAPSGLPISVRVFPVASAGGLVCFLDIGHRNFYICNPLTQSYKQLPPRPLKVWSRIAVGMSLIAGGTGYKIMWVGCDGEYEMYDSTRDAWFLRGNVPSSAAINLPLALNFRSQAVSVGSTLYFMRCYPDGILSYDVDTGTWKQHPIPSPRHVSDSALAECGGRIVLVGLLTKNAATCVCIWELQKMTLLWKEVDRMPNLWCLEFYGKHVKMSCIGNKGLLMLSLRSRKMNRLVSYDMATREWMKVPGCVLPGGKRKQCIATGTAFHPCLTA
ncbi:f-box family protein, partial [Genlisea aurea]